MVATKHIPQLNTAGVIAAELHEPLPRILHILATRPHIRPAARAGTLRLYRKEAIAQVRHELSAIEARRHARKDVGDAC